MNHGILKRVIALCIAGGVMALTLAACGDNEEDNEGTGTVQEVSQDVTREDEDGTVGVNESGDAVNADSSGNDVRVAHASSSGNSGNGFAIPMFKPGEEPDPGQESQPGEEPQPGADSKPGTGTSSSVGSQSSTGAQSGAGTQQPQQPQQPSTGTQTAHTHNWVTQTIHHGATGHYESRVVSTEQVLVSHTPAVYKFQCICGAEFDRSEEGNNLLYLHSVAVTWTNDQIKLVVKEGHSYDLTRVVKVKEEENVYEERDKVEDVWVVDTAAWDENITTCSICHAKQ